jgi:tetratricopeptide (TPR) repeat protein
MKFAGFPWVILEKNKRLCYIITTMRNVLLLFLLLASGGLYAETLPDWFIPLREAVYEQTLKADEIAPLFSTVQRRAEEALSGAARSVMLSRCEYMMGRAYQNEDRKEEAAARYAEGMSWAEKALKEKESAEAWQMLAENISQSCAVRSTGYAMANGLKVEQYAKKALALNKRNAACQYMIAARWVFAPWPFYDYEKGIKMMTAILSEGDMEKDDLFNVYSALGYGYIQQKKIDLARPWLLKSLEVYPSNQYALNLLKKK